MQIALKWSLVMLVNKVNFGEWVKRQMNYQTKQKTKTKPKKTQTTAMYTPSTLVLYLQEDHLKQQDFNRTYGFTMTSVYQLSCGNKYLISTNRLTFLIHFKQYRKQLPIKTGYKKNTKYFLFKITFVS